MAAQRPAAYADSSHYLCLIPYAHLAQFNPGLKHAGQVLGYIDHTITVNIIKNDKIVEKRALKLPKKITNVIQCKNPRCITSIEQELPHIFYLADEKSETYRCQYCEEKYSEFK